MKILGIGNAIVDVICKVNETFITKNELTKGEIIFDEKSLKHYFLVLELKTIRTQKNPIVGYLNLAIK